MAASDRVTFTCDGVPVDVAFEPGASLLDILREQLDIRSVKDGCAPQGQCGCCTVLVDGQPRVACVTPPTRVAGREVTTVNGLADDVRDRLLAAFVATGGSQCGFCTPGIVVRAAWLLARNDGEVTTAEIDRALAAHLCRCTGWLTVKEAIVAAARGDVPVPPRDLAAAGLRSTLEGGVEQRVAMDVPRGDGGFADDLAPRDAAVAFPVAEGALADEALPEAAGMRWAIGPTLVEARVRAGKIQGRRTTQTSGPPLELPECPAGGVRLATSWVEPAYLEPDASWCIPGGDAASPLANGGAFGGKVESVAPAAAKMLADQLDRPVRVVLAREDVVRLGPKRPPIAASAVLDGTRVRIVGAVVGDVVPDAVGPIPYAIDVDEAWTTVPSSGPRTSPRLRAWPLAERTVLVEGALAEAGADRAALARADRVRGVMLDACASEPTDGALAGAAVVIDAATGRVDRVTVRVAAGDPLDEIALRSYAMGATHMALGWVLHEGLTVDEQTGEVLDLTIRSFGILRAQDMPPIDVTVVDDAGPPRSRSSDAVFAAVAAATWNAVSAASGARPESFPIRP
jgi:aerobic-type carbon monoxide dehydrogenase small subunit (CoxS/CutS family)